MPQLKKAELIEGKVFMASPVPIVSHGRPHGSSNESQPDGLLRLEPEVGGTSYISEDGYVEGAPELIVEVATSSGS